jgi:tetratricopeptide (TPR) repeat protein
VLAWGSRACVALSACIAAGLLVCATARAETVERPWARGVSERDQARAQALFDAGNELLEDNLFAQALELYDQALERWDHPGIRYNVAVALINLERPIEAYQHLQGALRYGDTALEPELVFQARSYERLLEGQIVRLTVECTQPEVTVLLDGRDVLACPGERDLLLLPGEHQLTAFRSGYLTREMSLVLPGGEARRVPVELMTLDQATVEHRRWDPWKPWAVVGGGVAVAAAGLGFELRARATYQSYDNAIAILCAPVPCADEDLPDVVTAARSRARLQHRIGVGLLATGGAAAAAGVVMAFINRPVRERLGYDDLPALAPVVTGDGLGVAASWSF